MKDMKRTLELMERDQLTHIALVLEVEKHACLYNTTLPEYTRKDLTEEAWSDIAKTLKLPVAECKDKWRNIRSTFRRSFKPSRKGKLKRTYYLSRYLNFILPYSKPMEDSIFRETANNEDEDLLLVIKDVDEDSDNSVKEDLEPISTDAQTSWQIVHDVQEDNEEEAKFMTNDAQTKWCRTVPSEQDFAIPEHLRQKTEENSLIDHSDKEHMKYFFLSLLPEFKNMSEKQTRTFKIKVLQLIDDIKNERLSVVTRPHRLSAF